MSLDNNSNIKYYFTHSSFITDIQPLTGGAKGKKKWTTFVHNGVLFPPLYHKHNVPVIFDGERIILPEQAEEMATLYAKCLDTQYVTNSQFNKNFWKSWKPTLQGTKITSLEGCDLHLIYDYLVKKKSQKLELSSEEKKQMAKKKEESLKRFHEAYVDGKEQHVGNFVVEPVGIFIGRGCHPKIGLVKERTMPEDVTINISKNETIPKIYYIDHNNELVEMVDHTWGKIIHDNKVEWIASWRDSIKGKIKYVWLAEHSTFKATSDMKKFNVAQRLKKNLKNIREQNAKFYKSKDFKKMQLGTATYLIDKLALRVGNEKGEDEADTVGLTSLRVEHITLEGHDTITFDFLGKDSIRYFNTIKVEPEIYQNLIEFIKGKEHDDYLFDSVNSTDLNDHLQSFMKGLTAKVFRTCNSSMLFQHKIRNIDRHFTGLGIKYEEMTDDNRKEALELFERASIEVAKYCNHRKTVLKSLKDQLQRIKDKIEEMKQKKQRLQRKNRTKTVAKQITTLNKKITLAKGKLALKTEMKDISLTTSRMNYIDPRIIFAFSKRYNLPIEKLYSPAIIRKFQWASDVSGLFKF